MKAELLKQHRQRLPNGGLIEMKIWRPPCLVPTYRKERTFNEQGLESAPAFASESEERKFWETHDSTDYVDWSKAHPVVLPI